MISEVMRIGLFLIGLLLMVEVFLLYAKKRLTVDIAMAWEAAGTGIIVVSAVPALSRWCGLLSAGTAVAVFLCGLLVIWAGLRFSILLSVMQMKVQELAVQVSLLKEENLQLMQKVEEAENRPGGGVSIGNGGK